MKVRLSTLWVFVMFNIVFADIVGFLNPGTLEEMIAMKPTQGVLLAFSMLLEIRYAWKWTEQEKTIRQSG